MHPLWNIKIRAFHVYATPIAMFVHTLVNHKHIVHPVSSNYIVLSEESSASLR